MVSVKKGDVVLVEYTGRLASDNRVFDTTDEATARKWGILEKNVKYGQKIAVFGTKTIIPGIEDAILASSLGVAAEYKISPDKAFGKRIPELVRMMPEKDFAKQRVRPVPGMVVTLDGMLAIVKSVTSGRVVVDFNHPLAGEEVVYSVKVNGVVTDDSKRAEAILENYGLKGTVAKTPSGVSVEFDKSAPNDRVAKARQAITAIIPSAVIKS